MYNCLKGKKNLNKVSWIETHSIDDDEQKKENKYGWGRKIWVKFFWSCC